MNEKRSPDTAPLFCFPEIVVVPLFKFSKRHVGIFATLESLFGKMVIRVIVV
jgi:hypothetical protein